MYRTPQLSGLEQYAFLILEFLWAQNIGEALLGPLQGCDQGIGQGGGGLP